MRMHSPGGVHISGVLASGCAEAYVILCFLDLLYAYMHVRPSEKVDKPLAGRHVHLMFPLTLAFKKDTKLDQQSLSALHSCAAQFVWLRPVLSLVLLACALGGLLEHVSTPIAVILNLSVTCAVSALLSFYHTFEKELGKWKDTGRHGLEIGPRYSWSTQRGRYTVPPGDCCEHSL